jgi:hypothetical protein
LRGISHSQNRLESVARSENSKVTTNSNPGLLQAAQDSAARETTSGNNVLRPDRLGNDSAFEGASSITAHATFAGEFFEHTVERNSPQDVGPGMREALASLQKLLKFQNRRPNPDDIHFAHTKPLGKGGLRDLEMPPINIVVRILRELKERIPLVFTLICILNSVEYFTEQCRKVYFATEDFTISTFIIVNAGLLYILQEKATLASHAGDTMEGSSYQEHCNICRANLETVLVYMNLFMPARRENIEALVLGASYALDISKPSLAWQLNSIACHLCLTLGYHRENSIGVTQIDTHQKSNVLFWMAYIFDKALALRLGRPSILQDYDITLSRIIEPLGEFDEHRAMIQNWLAHAEVQGKIYENLYSPFALSQPVEQRVRTALACAEVLNAEADKLSQLWPQLEEAPNQDDEGITKIRVMLLRSDHVAILSTLVLVYRAVPAGTMGLPAGKSTMFCQECVDTARETMRMHVDCIKLVEASPVLASVYMHW